MGNRHAVHVVPRGRGHAAAHTHAHFHSHSHSHSHSQSDAQSDTDSDANANADTNPCFDAGTDPEPYADSVTQSFGRERFQRRSWRRSARDTAVFRKVSSRLVRVVEAK